MFGGEVRRGRSQEVSGIKPRAWKQNGCAVDAHLMWHWLHLADDVIISRPGQKRRDGRHAVRQIFAGWRQLPSFEVQPHR